MYQITNRWGEAARAESERKLASGKWRLVDRGGGQLDLEAAVDPDAGQVLEWDCPAGAQCRCHVPKRCPYCKRNLDGCLARCSCKRSKANVSEQ